MEHQRQFEAMGGLEEVLLAHRPQLLRFLRARGAGDAAEDLLQEAWLRVRAAKPGPVGDPLSYLYRVANNLMLDLRRTESRSAARDHEWQEVRQGAAGASDEPSGERVLIAREELRVAQSAIDALGERVAKVFRRYRLDNVSQREIAQELGISLSSVEKDLQRAYRALLDIRRRKDAEL